MALLLAAVHGPVLSGEKPDAKDSRYLTGELLVASPDIGDPRFRESVIYMLRHDADGAQGIIVNKVYGKGPVGKLLRGFGVDPESATGTIELHFGGPVRPDTAFLLHTSDYEGPETKSIDGEISFSTDIRILRKMGSGEGPDRFLLALGYAGWAPGQLEKEIERGDWTVAEATADLVFGGKSNVWERLSKSSALPL